MEAVHERVVDLHRDRHEPPAVLLGDLAEHDFRHRVLFPQLRAWEKLVKEIHGSAE